MFKKPIHKLTAVCKMPAMIYKSIGECVDTFSFQGGCHDHRWSPTIRTCRARFDQHVQVLGHFFGTGEVSLVNYVKVPDLGNLPWQLVQRVETDLFGIVTGSELAAQLLGSEHH